MHTDYVLHHKDEQNGEGGIICVATYLFVGSLGVHGVFVGFTSVRIFDSDEHGAIRVGEVTTVGSEAHPFTSLGSESTYSVGIAHVRLVRDMMAGHHGNHLVDVIRVKPFGDGNVFDKEMPSADIMIIEGGE